ncbi:hypothetical protein ABID22_000973 [Pontibacter aydingkolensis]|uniref:porin family protein n=1 Tax=Pontibacter aydingkolensis TaxID=1911536 RepID=UPI001FE4834A|nr:porin family protein [Pontibacter aydingkolensis]
MNRNTTCFIILISTLLLMPLGMQAQNSFTQRIGKSKIPERGLVIVAGGGISGVKSSICGSPGCNDFGPNASIGAWYKISPYVSLASSVDYVRLGASEKDPRRPLNVSFQSEVIEVTGTVVVNLLDSYAGSGNYRSSRKRFVVPYARAGGGFIYYTATSYPGDASSLEDSQTTYDPEREYPAIAAVIPFGGGLRFRFSDEIAVAGEAMYHLTTTKFLDNVGPRLLPASGTDHYAVAAIKIMYTPVIKNKIFSKKYQE